MSSILFGHRKIAKNPTTAGKNALCSFYCARCIIILSGNVTSWALPKIIQISINSDLFVFDKFTPFSPSIIVPQSGFFFLKGQMKGPLFPWESRQRRRGMVSDWFMSHTLLRCYAWIIDCRSGIATVGSWWRCRNVTFTDVTAAQILKRLCPSKAPIWARPSPTASARRCCLSECHSSRTDLAFATLSAQDSGTRFYQKCIEHFQSQECITFFFSPLELKSGRKYLNNKKWYYKK